MAVNWRELCSGAESEEAAFCGRLLTPREVFRESPEQ